MVIYVFLGLIPGLALGWTLGRSWSWRHGIEYRLGWRHGWSDAIHDADR